MQAISPALAPERQPTHPADPSVSLKFATSCRSPLHTLRSDAVGAQCRRARTAADCARWCLLYYVAAKSFARRSGRGGRDPDSGFGELHSDRRRRHSVVATNVDATPGKTLTVQLTQLPASPSQRWPSRRPAPRSPHRAWPIGRARPWSRRSAPAGNARGSAPRARRQRQRRHRLRHRRRSARPGDRPLRADQSQPLPE